MILTLLGIASLLLALNLGLILYWIHVSLGAWSGQTFWEVIKVSYPRIGLILPALVILGLVLILL